MTVLYFAWLRAKIGLGQEVLDPPASVATVADLVAWLTQRGAGYADAFSDLSCIRAAIDQEFVDLDTPLNRKGEVAFFPPVTGG
ncbi:MAG: molybdopterin converting factor subunit 1 [Alphaproteobacteria bacterium]|jgi:molybdopterin synthase sulfur carrier subunit